MKQYSLSELRDARAHVDVDRFPDRAAELDREIAARMAAGVCEPLSFRGDLTLNGRRYSWPFGELVVGQETLTIRAAWLFPPERVLARDDVAGIEETGWLSRGFRIGLRDEGPAFDVKFFPRRFDDCRRTLVTFGWIEPNGEEE